MDYFWTAMIKMGVFQNQDGKPKIIFKVIPIQYQTTNSQRSHCILRRVKNVKTPKNSPRRSKIGLEGQFYPLIKVMIFIENLYWNLWKKAHLCINLWFYPFFSQFEPLFHIFLISFIRKCLHHRSQQTKLPF